MKSLKINSLLISGLIFVFLIIFSLLLSSGETIAQEEEEEICEKKEITVIARDSQGNFIPNINFEIWSQTEDVDGQPKPGVKFASGKIDSILGKGIASFSDEENIDYCLKMWDKNKIIGEFWFYDDLTADCGQSVEITEQLGAIHFVLRNAENNLVKNKEFSVYTQRYDADDNPIKEKEDLVTKLNSSTEGESVIYVASRNRSLDGEGEDYYVFETNGDQGGTFIMYDIIVNDSDTTDVEYIFSDIAFYIKDIEDNPFPANSKLEIYEQTINYDNEKTTGGKIRDVYTNDKGLAIFENPAGIYAAKTMGGDGKYYYFYDLEMYDQERNIIYLTTDEEWSPSEGTCEADSKLTVITRNYWSDLISDINFELYEQTIDIDGKPAADTKITNGSTNENGSGSVLFNPDPRKTYVLKIYDKNPKAGEFWFFDNIKFTCGEDKEFIKYLSSINIVLRDADENLKKNQKFSLYTQKIDIDGDPIKEKDDLISSSLTTSEEGIATIYLADDHPYINDKKGTYIFTSIGENNTEFVEYNIDIINEREIDFNYIFSDIVFEIKDAAGNNMPLKRKLEFMNQEKSSAGDYYTNKTIKSLELDNSGQVKLEYPAGNYAARIKDDAGKYINFWNIEIKNQARTNKKLITPLLRVSPYDENNNLMPENTAISIYNMASDEAGAYYKNDKIISVKTNALGYAETILTPDVYLIIFKTNNKEYGEAIQTKNGVLQKINLKASSNLLIEVGKVYNIDLSQPQSNALVDKLKGYILLQVEENGEAWYVDESSRSRYYMKNGSAAYDMMKKFGLGITNENLKKIEIGLDNRLEEYDYDGDGLHDKLEEALGTDVFNSDSDNDGYSDGAEVKNGYTPLGSGKFIFDNNLSEHLKGKILLQVESKGEAWYINPKDGRRYYMKDGDSAYQIMRYLSLGITNENLSKIEENSL
ncbi:hypothetical protein DRH27_02020 [Candidatus Falkowbacteria bacterium]|nr:MAG: hypothetical protein DRH27_02020 [Candidatus Falkowbacteria bacterium]